MKDDLGDAIKKFEIYSSHQVMPGVYFSVRVDGRAFSTLTERMKYKHPYDGDFKQAMITVTKGLMEEFNPFMAYTQSDEISIVFWKETDLFNRRVEKLVSTIASYASCKFAQSAKLIDEIVMFDSRLIAMPTESEVVDYLHWRHIDAIRNALNSWCYWTLRSQGKSAEQATSELKGKDKAYKNELLFKAGINFNDVPLWQKRGIFFIWEEYIKEGLDPRTGEKKPVLRRMVKVAESLPTGEEFRNYVKSVLEAESMKKLSQSLPSAKV